MQVSTDGPTLTLSCQSHTWHSFGGEKFDPEQRYTSTTQPSYIKAYEEEFRGTKPVGLKAWVISELSSHKEKQLINHPALTITSKRRQTLLPSLNRHGKELCDECRGKKPATLWLADWPRAHSCWELPSEDGLSDKRKGTKASFGEMGTYAESCRKDSIKP